MKSPWVENVTCETPYNITVLGLRHLFSTLHHLTEALSFQIQEHLLCVIWKVAHGVTYLHPHSTFMPTTHLLTHTLPALVLSGSGVCPLE